MNNYQKIKWSSVIVFIITVVLFLFFFMYIGFHENVSVFSPRHSPYYGRIINLVPESVPDPEAPMGVRRVYSWLMDAHCDTGDFLCFYVSNNHVEVSVDGELIYALQSSGDNPIGRNVSSNWCIIPLAPEDAGKQFTIQFTPLIAETMQSEVEFLVGSEYNIVLGQLRQDTPQLILSIMCIALGLIIVLIQCYFRLFSDVSQWDILFMGIFSINIGIWRLTDIKSAPLIFSANPKMLGYISVGMLFLAGPALIQFVSTRFRERQASRVHILTTITSVTGLLVLAAQVFGIKELEECRGLSHIALIIGLIMVIIASFYGRKNSAVGKNQLAWKLLPLLAVGIFLDFTVYYYRQSSSSLIYTILFFLIFLAITFITSLRETTRMVYRDSRTGLSNKARWNEMMQMAPDVDAPFCILVLDLNGLKRVNDTLGHDAGDRMILAFVSILRNNLPSSSLICRWGGDEFTVMLPHVTREKASQHIDAIRYATVEYNNSDPEAKIYYAQGCALSEDYPGKSRTELFKLADEKMYQNKRRWYNEKKRRENAGNNTQ